MSNVKEGLVVGNRSETWQKTANLRWGKKYLPPDRFVPVLEQQHYCIQNGKTEWHEVESV